MSPKLLDLNIDSGNRLNFSVYIKKNAYYVGGFNIFGKGFGNHPHDIVMNAVYLK